MNLKHQLFCDTYLANGMNATQAYLSVYKCKSEEVAMVNSSRLLSNAKNPQITSYIDAERKKQSQNLGITRESQLLELKKIKELAMTPDVDGKLQLNVANKSIEIQNKMLGLDAPTKLEMSGKVDSDVRIITLI